MPTVKLPVEFKILTCTNCGRPYALIKMGIDLCPYCCSDILYNDHILKVSMKTELSRLKRSIRSLKGVVTKKQNEIDELKKNCGEAITHNQIPKGFDFDFKNPQNYNIVKTETNCSKCDYNNINGNCPSTFGYGHCVAPTYHVFKLKPEYRHLDPRNINQNKD